MTVTSVLQSIRKTVTQQAIDTQRHNATEDEDEKRGKRKLSHHGGQYRLDKKEIKDKGSLLFRFDNMTKSMREIEETMNKSWMDFLQTKAQIVHVYKKTPALRTMMDLVATAEYTANTAEPSITKQMNLKSIFNIDDTETVARAAPLQLIEGVPGSGKTRELIDIIRGQIARGLNVRILVVTPNKRARDGMAEAVLQHVAGAVVVIMGIKREKIKQNGQNVNALYTVEGNAVTSGMNGGKNLVEAIAHWPKQGRESHASERASGRSTVVIANVHQLTSKEMEEMSAGRAWNHIIVEEAGMIPLIEAMCILTLRTTGTMLFCGDGKQIGGEQSIMGTTARQELRIKEVKILHRSFRYGPGIARTLKPVYGHIASANEAPDTQFYRVTIKNPEQEKEGKSSVDHVEAKEALGIMLDLDTEEMDMSIICTYTAQRKLMEGMLRRANMESRAKIESIDSAQGMECDVAIVMTSSSTSIFAQENQRIAVAITRARYITVVMLQKP